MSFLMKGLLEKPPEPEIEPEVTPESRFTLVGTSYHRVLTPKYYGLSGLHVNYRKVECWVEVRGPYSTKVWWNGLDTWDYGGPRHGTFVPITEDEYLEGIHDLL